LRSTLLSACITSFFIFNNAFAQEGLFQGEVELGWMSTSGNTDTESMNSTISLDYRGSAWRHALTLSALRSKDLGETIANQRNALWRSTYYFGRQYFLFGDLLYEKDDFAGYQQRQTEVFGLGRDLVDSESFTFDVEAGLGARQTEQSDMSNNDEGIIRLGVRLIWPISENSAFKQDINTELGDDSTVTRSITSLRVNVNSRLAMKMSYKSIYNNRVPIGKEKRDSYVVASLIFGF